MSFTANRRLIVPLAVVGAAALVLSACSPGGGGEDAGGTAGGDEFSGETLEVSATWSGVEQENFEAVLAAFEEQTGATVNYTSFGDNAATTLGTQIEGGSPPNVAVLAQPALMRTLATDGHLQPLSEDALAAVQENYAEDWVDLGTVDGETYGVWLKTAHKSTVWYNADIYDEAGAEVPEDWDGFLEQLQIVADSGYAGISIGADVGWPLTDWFENVYLRTAGGEKYDQLANHEIPWTDPSVTEALDVLATLWGDDALVQEGAAQRTVDQAIVEVFGADPKAGTLLGADYVAGEITAAGDSTVGENALFYDFPAVNDSEPSVVVAGNAAVAFTDDAATDALMQFLASPEAAEIWIPKGGLISPNEAVDTNVYPDEISKQIAESLTSAETFRFDLSDLTPSAFGGTVGQGFWQIMIQFLEDPSDVAGTQQALEDAAVAAYAG